MALLFVDSCDHYDTATAPKKGYSSSYFNLTPGGLGASIGAYGRNSTNGWRYRVNSAPGSQSITTLTITNVSGTTAIVGVAFRMSALQTQEQSVFQIWNASAAQISLTVSSGGALSIRRGGLTGTALVTTATTLSASVWYFLELKILFSDTVGTYEIRIDGVSAGSGTGADTVNSGTAGWDSLVFGSVERSQDRSFDFDDLYVCDGSSGTNNTFLGDHRIVAVVASSGNGTNVDFSPSTGSDHGALVDENQPNETDYNQSGTVGHRDTYNFAAVGVAGTVKAVQTVNFIKADAAGVRYVGDVCRIGGTNYDSTGVVVGSDWVYRLEMHPTSPATAGAWTIAEIDGAEFGVKVTA
jgi:hypothetical protein